MGNERRRNGARLRILFCTIVAISAAATTDPLLEGASNAGLFGAGTYTDRSSLDVLPALVVATLLAIVYVSMRAYLEHKGAGTMTLRASLRAIATAPVWQIVPSIFVGQLGVLYLMETAEQIAVAGHPLGGTIWLGAPVVIALLVHAAVSVAMTLALPYVLGALGRSALEIARFVIALFWARPSVGRPAILRRFDVSFAAKSHPLASFSGERAPPPALS